MYARVTAIERQLKGTEFKGLGIRLDTILGDVDTCDGSIKVNG